ncbi:hypothetical protein PENPOL_c025G05755, partial [Penicillium polonicum]
MPSPRDGFYDSVENLVSLIFHQRITMSKKDFAETVQSRMDITLNTTLNTSPADVNHENNMMMSIAVHREFSPFRFVLEATPTRNRYRLEHFPRFGHITLPTDGSKPWEGFSTNLFRRLGQRADATIRFRWEMALLADYVVSVFGLPVPSNRIYILWDESAWEAAVTKADPTWEQRSQSIKSAL